MKEPVIPVANEGYPFIGYVVFLTLISALLGFTIITLLLIAVSTFVLMFFRDPERFIPAEDDAVICPADGKIIVAERVRDERFSEEELLKISIFMNVFNVHVNRNPVTGIIRSVTHVPGKFLAADNEKAHLKNEYCAIQINTEKGQEITVVQIAGLIARRIICWLEPGDAVMAGHRFGLIRFGSRVDLFLPVDTRLAVSVGQKVTAGETVLGRLITDKQT